MTDYIDLPIDNDTDLVADDDIKVDVADDGTVRGRVGFEDTVLYRGAIVHTLATTTEKGQHLAFYQANKLTEFTFTHGADTYTLRFSRHPRYKHTNGGRWRIEAPVIGTLD